MFQARDLLFARLLAYRAYQQVAALFAELEAGALRRYPRAVTLEARYLGLLPEIRIGHDAGAVRRDGGRRCSGRSRRRRSTWITSTPRRCRWPSTPPRCGRCWPIAGTATFGELVAGCTATLEVVARFLGLLNLYRESAVAFDQPEPLGTLTVRWTLAADGAGATPAAAPMDEEYE